MKALALFKPEYLCNPPQMLRRLRTAMHPVTSSQVIVRTPWGWPIEVRTADDIGKSLIHLGIYDLAVAEVLWRLCEPRETALDIGANIGLVTSLLARRVGPAGRVLAFEAHPEVAAELRSNVARWSRIIEPETIKVWEAAVSSSSGEAVLDVPATFARNRGTCRIAAADGNGASPAEGSPRTQIAVPTVSLDDVLQDVERVGTAKMDVEGHEELVLRGAHDSLSRKKICDWVFEHHDAYPSAVTDLFESYGYAVFQIRKRFLGPAIVPAAVDCARSAWEPPNCVATIRPDRLLGRLRTRGWQVLRGAPAS